MTYSEMFNRIETDMEACRSVIFDRMKKYYKFYDENDMDAYTEELELSFKVQETYDHLERIREILCETYLDGIEDSDDEV